MIKSTLQIFIGYEPRESDAFMVALHSARAQAAGLAALDVECTITGISMDRCREAGLYWRPTTVVQSSGRLVLWDTISDAPMSTQFAITRFLTPHLAGLWRREAVFERWALFVDCDMLFRRPLVNLWRTIRGQQNKAVVCVQHQFKPNASTKMDGQVQTQYERKNWSSVMAFNLLHQANEALTLDMVNSAPGRDLHAFCWLADDDIGAMPATFNHLVGHTANIDGQGPHIVHFTDGVPSMEGYADTEYADEWRQWLHRAVTAPTVAS